MSHFVRTKPAIWVNCLPFQLQCPANIIETFLLVCQWRTYLRHGYWHLYGTYSNVKRLLPTQSIIKILSILHPFQPDTGEWWQIKQRCTHTHTWAPGCKLQLPTIAVGAATNCHCHCCLNCLQMGIGQNRCCIAPPSIALASIDLLGHLNTANSFRPYFNAKISALTGMEHMMAASAEQNHL